MDEFDWMIVLIIIGVVLFFGFFYVRVNAMERACEDEGGKLSGSLDCRKGNEFYGIYPTNKWSLFDYTINKHPKTER